MIHKYVHLTLLGCLTFLAHTSSLPNVDVSTLDGNFGISISKSGPINELGYSFSNIGDLNGDHIEDIIVGIPDEDNNNGALYVIYGDKMLSNIDLSNPETFKGFKINGLKDAGRLGDSISRAGDVNGDELEDILIGAPNSDNDKGAAFVIFGKKDSSDIDVSSMDNTQGFKISGLTTKGQLGYAVNRAGDVNGDGVKDIIVGAPYADNNKGAAFVIFGTKKDVLPEDIDVTTMTKDQGFKVEGKSVNDKLGIAVASAGDIDQDGKDDIVIGAPGVDGSKGAVYAIYGTDEVADIDLNSFDDSQGVIITGENAGGQFGFSLSQTGDLNGDGKNDIIIGASHFDGLKGDVYVIYVTPELSNIDMGSLEISQGIKITSPSQTLGLGYSVSQAGDVNDDEIDDIVIGIPKANNNKGGAYVIFGTKSPSNINLDQLKDTQGFKISPASSDYNLGCTVNAGGDFNGDDIQDIILGSSNFMETSGKVYIVFGFGEAVVIPDDPHGPMSPEIQEEDDDPIEVEVIGKKDTGLSMGVIIGIIAGGVLVAIFGIILGVRYSSKIMRRKGQEEKIAKYEYVIDSPGDTPVSLPTKVESFDAKNDDSSHNKV